MAIIKWRDSYNTGVGKIDKEHQKLVELIEMMHEAIRDGATLQVVGKALSEITDYTEFHFANEKSLMEEYNYPEKQNHIDEHEKLKEEAAAFSERLAKNFPDGIQEFYKFLREWLVNHILDVDKKLANYLLKLPK